MKTTVFAVLRWAAAAAGIALIVLGMIGQKDTVSETPFETVLAAVTAEADLSGTKEGTVQMIRRLYGIDPAAYEQCALYYPSTNMGAEELLLVKLKDPADAETLIAAAEKRLETQLNVFEGYGVEQTALLTDHARIEAQGNYFLFIVNAAADAAVSAFYEVL